MCFVNFEMFLTSNSHNFLMEQVTDIKFAPLDSEFNSESDGDTFIYGKTIGKISSGFFLLYIYV